MQLNTEKMIGEKEGGVGWMTFNNPARRNAMALEMWSAVEAILDEFESDDAIKVIVMKGAGDKAFVSGADISEFSERRNNAEAAAEYARISEGARARLLAVKKPLIAMIQGYCLGGGFEMAMWGDFIVAGENAQFGLPEVRHSRGHALRQQRFAIRYSGGAAQHCLRLRWIAQAGTFGRPGIGQRNHVHRAPC